MTEGIYKTADGQQVIHERYRTALEHWPAAHEELTVATREGDTFVLASGPKDAAPVLLFHGTGANSLRWLAAVAAWSEHARVYAVDLIGEPGLSAQSRPPLDSEAHALWLDDVLEGLGLSRVSMVGESLGGWLALDYATRRPERVEKLVLLNPSGLGRQKVGLLLKAGILLQLGEWGRRKAFRMVAGGRQAAAAHPADAAILSFTMLVHEHFKSRMQKIPTFGDDALRRASMPVLAVLGAQDAMLDAPATARRLKAAVPQVTVRLLPDAGHFLPVQTSAVLGFLNDSRSSHA